MPGRCASSAWRVADKLPSSARRSERRGVPLEETAYLGNDVNDAGCLERSGSRSSRRRLARGRAARALVLSRRGGYGCVREFCDAVWAAKRAGARLSDPLFDLEGRVAIVTGGWASSGGCTPQGSPSAGCASRASTSRRVTSPTAFARTRSTSPTERSIERALTIVEAEWGVPHVLVNNAALDSPPDAPAEEVGPFEDYPEASFDAVMDVNVKGTFLCCQAVGGAMAREGRGSIVNVSSVYGLLSPVRISTRSDARAARPS